MSDRALVPHSYDQGVRDMFFTHFVLHDRKIGKCYTSVAEIWDEEWGVIPTRKTVERWCREYDWPYQADLIVSQTFPQLYQRDIARLVALRSKAISAYDDILDGTFSGQHPMSASQAARHVLELTVAGISVAPPKGSGGMDEERGRRQKERLETARGLRTEKKR
jgi:hypothetical protein